MKTFGKNKSFSGIKKFERRLFRFAALFYPLAIFLVAFFVAVGPFGRAQTKSDISDNHDELLVKLRGKDSVYRVKELADIPLDEMRELYSENPWVEYAEPNTQYEIAAEPNDPEYSKQWYLSQDNLLAAWDATTGSEDVIVAVLDTGVQIDHPDLKDNIWVNALEIPGNGVDDDRNGLIDDVNGWNFVEGNNDPRPQPGIGSTTVGVNHGTMISGIIGAVGNNGINGTGVAWKVRIMPLRVLDSRGTGNAAAVEQAIDYAIKNGAKILNLSFVGSERSITLDRAIERAYNSNVLTVVAAGNFSTNGANGIDMDVSPMYPACSEGVGGENIVLSVAALDTLDQKLNFSNYGRCVDISAPGIGIYSTLFFKPDLADFASLFGGPWKGTSMAAPQISGAAALLRSLDVSFTNAEIRDLLLLNSSSIEQVNPNFRDKLGRGRLDAGAAVRAANVARTEKGVRIQIPTSEPRYVITPLSGYAPEVRVIDKDSKLQQSFMAYAPAFRGGLTADVGDLDGDGKEEIVTGAGPGGGPHIRIFDAEGRVITQFFAFETSFRGGVRVKTLDINGDGSKEIAVASGKGRVGEVRIFSRDGSLLQKFSVFGNKFKNGFSLSAGDINGDGSDEVVVGAGQGGGPHVQIFKTDGTLMSEFFAYERGFNGGIEVSAPDTNGDGQAEIAVAPRSGRNREVRVSDYLGNLAVEFQVYDDRAVRIKSKLSGLTLSYFDFDDDGKDEIVAGEGIGGNPVIRVFTGDGLLFSQTDAYGADMRGGIGVSVLHR